MKKETPSMFEEIENKSELPTEESVNNKIHSATLTNDTGRKMIVSTTNMFPLISAYDYLHKKGFGRFADEVKETPVRYKNYYSSVRRGWIINFMEENGLLDDFIDQCWPNGKTKTGISEMNIRKNIRTKFLAENK